MICVDTSVWVEAMRDAKSAAAAGLRELIDQDEVALAVVVRMELLEGAKTEDRRRLRRIFSALPCYYPNQATWKLIDQWLDRAADEGQRFGIADLLIAAMAAENNASIWSRDKDFDRMAKIGFIELHKA